MKRVNEKTIRALVDAGAIKSVKIIADGATIHVRFNIQSGPVTATTNKGAIKTWASIDSSAKWIRRLGIGKAQVEMSKWLPDQKRIGF